MKYLYELKYFLKSGSTPIVPMVTIEKLTDDELRDLVEKLTENKVCVGQGETSQTKAIGFSFNMESIEGVTITYEGEIHES
ncbi:hypothetical protein SUFG_00063 [Sulfitobacter phage phiCB2047-B]|uniref:Uncharacterized protein n=1 Tax=Sulfitobacter phage phiCB2047-B TaxID=754046 RepID=M4PQQ0_9CAUD|nr:hypothetical protein SUFG_00063 [Sulfitobacter phage phiCB2047-B]AGH07430.1 hypothetical protein SUFG_00063 [Sulfitobacter phage phiCB2047-B]